MVKRGPADIRGFFAKDARLWFLDMSIFYVKAHLEIRAPQEGLLALRALKRRGVVLHMASGDSHDDLVEFLQRMGARDLFDRVYGSDLVNTWKFGPEYYRAVLTDSGVDADRAAVVDDSPNAISWARECGLRAFRVERRAGKAFDDAVARTFDEVARAID